MTWKNSSKGLTTGSNDWSRKLTDWWKKEAQEGNKREYFGTKPAKKYPLKEQFLKDLNITKRGK